MKNMIIGIILDILKVAIIAAGVSYFVANRASSSQEPQVMVVRTTDVQKGIKDFNDPDQQRLVQQRSLQLKELVIEAAERGVVVVDADAVLRAPAHSYITLVASPQAAQVSDETDAEVLAKKGPKLPFSIPTK